MKIIACVFLTNSEPYFIIRLSLLIQSGNRMIFFLNYNKMEVMLEEDPKCLFKAEMTLENPKVVIK